MPANSRWDLIRGFKGLRYVLIFSSNILVFEIVSYSQATNSCSVFIPVGSPICPTCPPYRKRQKTKLATTDVIKNPTTRI